MSTSDLSRRHFLASGAGLFIFVRAEAAPAYQEPARLPQRGSYPTDFNAYLRIGEDGRVTGFAGKVELG
jgi:isoquinoline 1-oxidoreductase